MQLCIELQNWKILWNAAEEHNSLKTKKAALKSLPLYIAHCTASSSAICIEWYSYNIIWLFFTLDRNMKLIADEVTVAGQFGLPGQIWKWGFLSKMYFCLRCKTKIFWKNFSLCHTLFGQLHTSRFMSLNRSFCSAKWRSLHFPFFPWLACFYDNLLWMKARLWDAVTECICSASVSHSASPQPSKAVAHYWQQYCHGKHWPGSHIWKSSGTASQLIFSNLICHGECPCEFKVGSILSGS